MLVRFPSPPDLYIILTATTLPEIMDILRHKKAQLPVPPITSTKKRKITSTATIADSDSADVLMPEAGSSTGLGTLTQSLAGQEDVEGS